VFVLGRPSEAKLARTLERVRRAALTYEEQGATAAAMPPGYHHVRATRVLGTGESVYAAACDGLRTWQLHRGQGFLVAPVHPPLVVGANVVSAVRLAGPVHVLAACRIVWTVDEPDRFGFAYGTLPVHPARGEESFVVERAPSGEVRVEITAFSRPRHPLVRLGGPVARRQQAAATEGYLDALVRHVRASGA
jgi:uncharacterized protein (UPF0548 family)